MTKWQPLNKDHKDQPFFKLLSCHIIIKWIMDNKFTNIWIVLCISYKDMINISGNTKHFETDNDRTSGWTIQRSNHYRRTLHMATDYANDFDST